MARPLGYFRSVVDEGKKVVWPSRQTVLRHTGMVIIVVLISSAIFAGVDYLFQQLVLASITR